MNSFSNLFSKYFFTKWSFRKFISFRKLCSNFWFSFIFILWSCSLCDVNSFDVDLKKTFIKSWNSFDRMILKSIEISIFFWSWSSMFLKKVTNSFTFFCFERKLYTTTFTKMIFDDVKHFFERKSFDVRLIFLFDLIFEIRTTFFYFQNDFLFFSFFTLENGNDVRFKMIIDESAELIFSKLILNSTSVLWRIDDVFSFSFLFWRQTSK